MTRHIVVAAFLAALTAPAFSAELKCRASDESNRNRKDVETTILKGAIEAPLKLTRYAGYDVTVVYQTGSQFDSQTSLTLTAGDASAQTYNVSQKGVYKLIAPKILLSCWFE